MRGSRTKAPRGVRMLCIERATLSAMQSTFAWGKWMFIAAGASVPGVSWKLISTPSTTSVWPVFPISTVGGISVIVPSEVVCPRPAPSCPAGPRSSSAPYM
jgi:hypothetical protein